MGLFQDRMDQRSARMDLDNAAWRMRISHSKGSREAAQMQGDAAQKRLDALSEQKKQETQAQATRDAALIGAQASNPAAFSRTPLLDQKMGLKPGMSSLDRINALAATARGEPVSGASGGTGTIGAQGLTPTPASPQSISILTGFDPTTASGTTDNNASGILRYAQGGPVRGPRGLDQVPAQMPDGSPARLNAGEYVQPREEVIAYALQVLGEASKGLSEDQLNAIGLKLLSQRTEEMTGREPGPEMGEPLPRQGLDAVPSMANGSGDELSAGMGFDRLPRLSPPQTDPNAAASWAVRRGTRPPKSLAAASRSTQQSTRDAPLVQGHQDAPSAESNAKTTKSASSGDESSQASEQDLLNQMAPQGASLQRMENVGRGNVFRYEDPMAMRPGSPPPAGQRGLDSVAPPASGRVIRGRDSFPVVNGWEAPNGRTSLAMAAKRDHTYDHLPISGVTYSDSIGGTSFGQSRAPNVSGKPARDLGALYQKEAVGRAKSAAQQGRGTFDVLSELNAQPAISEQDRAQQISNRNALNRQRQEQLGLQALAARGSKGGSAGGKGNGYTKDVAAAFKSSYGDQSNDTTTSMARELAPVIQQYEPDPQKAAALLYRATLGMPDTQTLMTQAQQAGDGWFVGKDEGNQRINAAYRDQLKLMNEWTRANLERLMRGEDPIPWGMTR